MTEISHPIVEIRTHGSGATKVVVDRPLDIGLACASRATRCGCRASALSYVFIGAVPHLHLRCADAVRQLARIVWRVGHRR